MKVKVEIDEVREVVYLCSLYIDARVDRTRVRLKT